MYIYIPVYPYIQLHTGILIHTDTYIHTGIHVHTHTGLHLHIGIDTDRLGQSMEPYERTIRLSPGKTSLCADRVPLQSQTILTPHLTQRLFAFAPLFLHSVQNPYNRVHDLSLIQPDRDRRGGVKKMYTAHALIFGKPQVDASL